METDSDTDQELADCQSQSEPIRFTVIQILRTVFVNERSEVSQEKKEHLAHIALPLIIKEMSQVNHFKSLQACLEVLISISGFSNELASRIIEDQSVLRMLDSHLLNGSLKHKQLALMLLLNLVLNSLEDALKVVKDLGILRRVFECIHSRKEV